MAATSLVTSLGSSVLDYVPSMTAIYMADFTIIAACMFLLTSKASPRR